MSRHLRVCPDYTADPVWADDGMVVLESLPLTDDLVDRMRAWAREWERLLGLAEGRFAVVDETAYAAWLERGRGLAARLQRELGEAYDVEYVEPPR